MNISSIAKAIQPLLRKFEDVLQKDLEQLEALLYPVAPADQFVPANQPANQPPIQALTPSSPQSPAQVPAAPHGDQFVSPQASTGTHHTARPAYGEPWHKGHGQLQGSDTSKYQSKAMFEKAIRGTKFAAIRSSEGTGYTDPTFKARWKELGHKIDKGQMKLRIAYHYLDKGNGTAQAKHFLHTLGIHGKLKPGTRLALDWEGKALSSPKTLHDAANYIHKVTGLWPLVYTSASEVGAARRAVPHAPMWEARWTGGRQVHNVPFVQYSDGPGYDHDVFNGSLKALEKFAGF